MKTTENMIFHGLSSSICNGFKLVTTQMPIKRGSHKGRMRYNGMLHNNKNEHIHTTRMNLMNIMLSQRNQTQSST